MIEVPGGPVQIVQDGRSNTIIETPDTTNVIVTDDGTIIIKDENDIIELSGSGPPGVAGPPGASGGAYIHTQTVPSAVWTITHPLNRAVNVAVYDENGCMVNVAVVEISASVVEVRASAAFAGHAVAT